MDTRSSIGDIEPFSISRESFDSYRRSFVSRLLAVRVAQDGALVDQKSLNRTSRHALQSPFMTRPDKVSIRLGFPACLGRRFETGLSTDNHPPQRKRLKTLV